MLRLILTIAVFLIGSVHMQKCDKTIESAKSSVQEWEKSIKKGKTEQKALIDKLYNS
jgi:uncharacterized protein YoxC